MIEHFLLQEMRDLLNAESQLVKALPKLIKAARSQPLKSALEEHLEETKQQIERLKEAFALLSVEPKGTPSKGMAGLVEKAEDVIDDVNGREDASADLALIVAAQRFEHYEISAYRTARTMAGHSGLPAVAELLDTSLAEEEMADDRMSQLARGLMSGSRSGTRG